ncbi:hypothetical protein ACS0TY_023457 [Phlomoides rotata]
MNNCLSLSLPPPMYINFSVRCRFPHSPVTSATRRHHRRRLLKYSPNRNQTPILAPTIFKLSDDSIQITLKSPLNSLQKLESKLNQFLDLGREAYDDLRTIVTVDGNNGGVVISCRRSTVEFLVAVFFATLIVVITFRSLFRIRRNDGEVLVYKRDRSLGGKEVVVGRENSGSTSRTWTPLSSDNADYKKKSRMRTLDRRKKKELPQWWPRAVNQGPNEIDNKEEYQRIANQLIQAIMDRKMSGEDISTNDIVQALEVQNRHSEALVELFKVCLIHRIFPPEENSPEMEMVARGLDKSLDAEQREYILNSFVAVCGEDIDQSVVEALGLVGVMDEQGNQHV